MIDVEIRIDHAALAKLLGAPDEAAGAMAEAIQRGAQERVPVKSGELKTFRQGAEDRRGPGCRQVRWCRGSIRGSRPQPSREAVPP